MEEAPYQKPGWFTKRVFNPLVALASWAGISMAGSRRLTVAGRETGELRTTPVNPLRLEGQTYLVAPRGNTQWARNLRVVGEGELHHGRRGRRFRGEELQDAEKLPVLKAYLDKWAWEVGAFFELDKDPSDAEIRRIAPDHPVFRIRYLD